jgi:outer membrane receptor for ferrienterochelin and colicin
MPCDKAFQGRRKGIRVRKLSVSFVTMLSIVAAPAFATIFATLKGVVHDPQHRPVPGAVVTLKARQADWIQTATTDNDGTFQIAAVPAGDYTVTVVLQGFNTAQQTVTVVSDTAPVIHVQLELAGVREAVTVSASAEGIGRDSVTPTTMVSRQDIQNTPGAARTNGLESITAFVAGSYATHDQLHIRGGHQVSWLIDGVPVPNTNIASNVGPQFDPKDIDYLEVHRGSYEAQYGDRTYGVFNVIPRTGFERNNEAELVVSAGNFHQTNDHFSIGGHTQRFAYYVSANGNHSDLGLGTPVADVLHDRQTGGGGFASLIFNINPANQLRVVTSVRRDTYQIPNAPDDQAVGINDVERESDAFVNVSWVRTFKSGMLLTVSPFYHHNAANLDGGPIDPIVTTDERASQYGGAQATFGAEVAKNNIQVGFYGFHQRDDQLFGLVFNDGSNPNLAAREQPSGKLLSVFIQDKVSVTSWLTVMGGLRQTHFSGAITETATSPRIGASIQIPSVNWVVRGFYGRFYQGPPLITASGPLVSFVTTQNLGFIPLHGERDEEYQVGLMVPIRGWTVDADRFQTRATNFFDHNPLGNSNVFFPVTIDGALIRGTEVTLRSPRTWSLGQFHLAYSNQTAQGRGSISGGLTDFSSGGGYFPLDHDQRHTFSSGFDARLPGRVFAATNVSYASGLVDSGGPEYLPGHTTVNVSLGKSFGEKVSLSITALNVANSHLLIDNSLTFGGTHFNNPREIYGELRYRFHY